MRRGRRVVWVWLCVEIGMPCTPAIVSAHILFIRPLAWAGVFSSWRIDDDENNDAGGEGKIRGR